MASEVEICNLALARLGDNATVASIDPPEGSAQSEHCARFYPIARDSLLELHNWRFATRRSLLSKLVTDSWNWKFAYAEPTGVIKLLAVLPKDSPSDQQGFPFESEGSQTGASLILTDVEAATLRYIARVVDTTKFPPLFVDALGWLLASYLAGPVLKGDAGSAEAKRCYQVFITLLGQARASDANQSNTDLQHVPDWMAARGAIVDGSSIWSRN